jgi:hypothetical protein
MEEPLSDGEYESRPTPPPKPLPLFALTLDQPFGSEVSEANTTKRRIAYAMGAVARCDAAVYNYFALAFLVDYVYLPVSAAVRKGVRKKI